MSQGKTIDLCNFTCETCVIYRQNTPVVYPSMRVCKQEENYVRNVMRAMLNGNISGAFTVSRKNGLHIKTLYGNYYFTSASPGEFTNKIFITQFEIREPSKRSLYVEHLREKYHVPPYEMTDIDRK